MRYVALMAVIVTLSGCGFATDNNHKNTLAKDESVYEIGSPVPAEGFNELQIITLSVFKKGASGKSRYVEIVDGEYLTPDSVYSMAVTVPKRTVDGEELDQRVFISDGGWSDVDGNRVEAVYDAEKDMYLADFNLSGPDQFLITPLLVQVIGSDGKAAKAKFLVTTQDELAASYGNLVDRGFCMTLSKKFLASLPDLINPIMDEQFGSKIIKVNSISPANNGSGKKTNGIINVNAAGVSFDVILNDSVVNSSGEVTRGLYVGVEDVSSGTMGNGLEILMGIFTDLFFKGLRISDIPMTALGMGLGPMIDSVMTSSEEGLSIPGLNIPELEIAVDLDSTIYLNLKGYPEETTSGFAVMGGSMYVPDNDDVIKNSKGYYLWPEVSVDTYDTMIEDGMDTIMDNATDIGMVLSQYNINQMLQALMKNLNVEVKSINTQVALFSPKVKTDNLDLVVMINPKGIAVDFPTKRVVANDVKLLLIESGEVNGPVSELSLDLTMVFDVVFRMDGDSLFMDLSVEPIEELCHMHVMKDESGMTSLDHGKFVPIIFQYLGGGGSTLTIPVPLSDLGIVPRKGVTPGTVTVDDYGNCFLSMAVSSIDATKLSSGGGCFIETAVK